MWASLVLAQALCQIALLHILRVTRLVNGSGGGYGDCTVYTFGLTGRFFRDHRGTIASSRLTSFVLPLGWAFPPHVWLRRLYEGKAKPKALQGPFPRQGCGPYRGCYLAGLTKR